MNFHSMSDNELNEWIARKRGWKTECFYQSINGQSGFVIRLITPEGKVADWSGSHTQLSHSDIWNLMDNRPDYCNKWIYAGELEEEGKFTIAYDLHTETWFVYPQDANTVSDDLLAWNAVLPRAISEAYAVMTETLGDMTKKDGEG